MNLEDVYLSLETRETDSNPHRRHLRIHSNPKGVLWGPPELRLRPLNSLTTQVNASSSVELIAFRLDLTHHIHETFLRYTGEELGPLPDFVEVIVVFEVTYLRAEQIN